MELEEYFASLQLDTPLPDVRVRNVINGFISFARLHLHACV